MYTTQMDAARKGIVTKEMEIVAKKENIEYPRSYRDYDATIDLAHVPNGVQVGFQSDPYGEICWDKLPETETWFRHG